MTRFIPFFAISILFFGCVSGSRMVSPDVEKAIPDEATVVVIHSSDEPEDLYESAYKTLSAEGYPIESSNDEMQAFSTGFKEVDQETTLAVNVSVNEAPDGSRARLHGRWSVTTTMAAGFSSLTGADIETESGDEAIWKPHSRAGVAFGAMASLAQGIPHDSISYQR